MKAKKRQLPIWIVPLISVIPLWSAVSDYRDGSWVSALIWGAFGLLFLAGGVVGMLQQRQIRRVAGVMATAPTGTHVPPAASGTPDPGLPRLAPPARVEMIESATLPPAVFA